MARTPSEIEGGVAVVSPVRALNTTLQDQSDMARVLREMNFFPRVPITDGPVLQNFYNNAINPPVSYRSHQDDD